MFQENICVTLCYLTGSMVCLGCSPLEGLDHQSFIRSTTLTNIPLGMSNYQNTMLEDT